MGIWGIKFRRLFYLGIEVNKKIAIHLSGPKTQPLLHEIEKTRNLPWLYERIFYL